MLLPLFKNLIFEQLRNWHDLYPTQQGIFSDSPQEKKKKSQFLSVAFTEFFCSPYFLAEYIV